MNKPEGIEVYRSKLYILQDGKEWLDQGTGFPVIAKEVFISLKYLKYQDDKDILKFTLEETGLPIYEVELTGTLEIEQQEGIGVSGFGSYIVR